MDKLALILLVAFANLSTGLWSLSAELVDAYGLVFPLFLAMFQMLLLCALLQAERAIVVHAQHGKEDGSWQFATFTVRHLGNVFLISCFVASLVLAAHNMIVLAMQAHIFSNIYTHSYVLEDLPALFENRQLLFDVVVVQLLVLGGVGLGFFVMGKLLIWFRNRQIDGYVLSALMLVIVAFFMLFFWQNERQSFGNIQLDRLQSLRVLVSSLTVAVESSLSGFGIFFVLKTIFGFQLRQSFLGLSVIVLVILSALSVIGSWVLADTIGLVSFGFFTDRLLVLLPLYMNSLHLSEITMPLWIVVVASTVAIKTILLTGVCCYVVKTLFFPQLHSEYAFASICIALLAFAGFLLMQLPKEQFADNDGSLFELVFVRPIYYWYPFQLALLCLLAFLLPARVHSVLLPTQTALPWLEQMIRWVYFLLAISSLAWAVQRIFFAH